MELRSFLLIISITYWGLFSFPTCLEASFYLSPKGWLLFVAFKVGSESGEVSYYLEGFILGVLVMLAMRKGPMDTLGITLKTVFPKRSIISIKIILS